VSEQGNLAGRRPAGPIGRAARQVEQHAHGGPIWPLTEAREMPEHCSEQPMERRRVNCRLGPPSRGSRLGSALGQVALKS
jgi:hypothetical protein